MLRDYQKHSYAKDLVYNELLQNFLGQYKIKFKLPPDVQHLRNAR